ncbi:MAG: phospholipase [Acidimicrobiaceae bacterium]|nr:phospholipase [Acidimicrobiaceae bacterium]
MTRRHFLGGAVVVGGALLTGCRNSGRSSAKPARTKPPDTRPQPTLPEGIGAHPEIEHIVVLMMENHSFDNYFGMLGRGDGFAVGADGRPLASNPNGAGKVVRAFEMPTPCQLADQPSQSWNASHAQLAGGRMDGFVTSDSGPVAMGYWTERTLPYYYALGRTFPIADRYFASCLASTFPNRRFLQAGSALGLITNVPPSFTDPPPPNGTVWDRLNAHGISWANYYVDLPEIGLFPSVYLANQARALPMADYFTAAKAGTLPAVSLVTPQSVHASEENPQDIQQGESFAAGVINAAMAGPGWRNTVLVWTYDEHGGYFDHVAPPAAVLPDAVAPRLQPGDTPGGYDRYGFRVPCAVISPFARRGYVSSVVHDHTSILRLIETQWNLPAITARDANASNLMDMLDLDGPPSFPEPPPMPAPGLSSAPSRCSATGPGAIPPPGVLQPAAG